MLKIEKFGQNMNYKKHSVSKNQHCQK